MSPFVASSIQPDWFLSYLLGRIERVACCISSLSVQSIINRMLCLVPPDPCKMPQFHVVRTSGISQARLHSASRSYAATSHFKFNQVKETLVISSNSISSLTELSHASPNDCVGGGNRVKDPYIAYEAVTLDLS